MFRDDRCNEFMTASITFIGFGQTDANKDSAHRGKRVSAKGAGFKMVSNQGIRDAKPVEFSAEMELAIKRLSAGHSRLHADSQPGAVDQKQGCPLGRGLRPIDAVKPSGGSLPGVAPERCRPLQQGGKPGKAATSDLAPASGRVDQMILGLMCRRRGLEQRHVDHVEKRWAASVGVMVLEVRQFSSWPRTDRTHPRAKTRLEHFASRDAKATFFQRIGEAHDALDVGQRRLPKSLSTGSGKPYQSLGCDGQPDGCPFQFGT